jgi:hypothetical protein
VGGEGGCYSELGFFFPQRAAAAFLAISARLRGESFSARALPPFDPPSLPSATAAGFFDDSRRPAPSMTAAPLSSEDRPVASWTIAKAIWLMSRGRFGRLAGVLARSCMLPWYHVGTVRGCGGLEGGSSRGVNAVDVRAREGDITSRV